MIDKSKIKDDLYEAVNGKWLETAVIPEDRPTIGGFQDLVIGVEDLLIDDFNNLKEQDLQDDCMKEFLKFYHLTQDFKKRDKEGIKGIQKYIEKLENLKNYDDFLKIIKELELIGVSLPFHISVSADMKDAKHNVLYLDLPHMILPDKTYYDENHNRKKELLNKYQEMVSKILKICNFDEKKASELIKDTLDFDNLIHPNSKTSVELADYTKMYNPRHIDEVEKYVDVFSFKNIFNEYFGFIPEKIIVTQPKFFENYKSVMNEDTFKIFKSWLLVNFILGFSSSLTNELRIIGGEYSRYLSGITKAKSVEKYTYYYATGMYSGVISLYYGKKYFGEKAKKDVHDMVVSMLEVYKERLAKNEWLKESTIKNAIKKLNKFEILVGYPDDYKDYYNKLKIDENLTFVENIINFDKIKSEYELSKLDKLVERKEWHMPSNMVNAYYSPTSNLICFPAAILQAPFYSLKQTKSENYGGIGAVIGHEISHAFDNNGAKFDEDGTLNNWWSDEDFAIFDEKAKAMIEQFDGLLIGDLKVNGTLTVSENIADAGGLSCSLEALKNTGEYNLEEFFINFAKIWCMKAKPEYLELLVSVDVHAPARLRGTIQPRNLQDFYDTFDVKEGDGMYLPPSKRVSIW